jgi:Ribonuclease G/E
MIHIDLIDKDIKHLATEVYNVTATIRKDLENGTVQAVEHYAASIVPEIDPLYHAVLALCDKVLVTCQLIQQADWSGVEARLQRLVSDIVALKHGNKHGIGKYIAWCQVVIDFLIGK